MVKKDCLFFIAITKLNDIDISIRHGQCFYGSPLSWHVFWRSAGPSYCWFWPQWVDFSGMWRFMRKTCTYIEFDGYHRRPDSTLYEDISFWHVVNAVGAIKMTCCLSRCFTTVFMYINAKMSPKIHFCGVGCLKPMQLAPTNKNATGLGSIWCAREAWVDSSSLSSGNLAGHALNTSKNVRLLWPSCKVKL